MIPSASFQGTRADPYFPSMRGMFFHRLLSNPIYDLINKRVFAYFQKSSKMTQSDSASASIIWLWEISS